MAHDDQVDEDGRVPMPRYGRGQGNWRSVPDSVEYGRQLQMELVFPLYGMATEQMEYALAQIRVWALQQRRHTLPDLYSTYHEPDRQVTAEEQATLDTQAQALDAALASTDRDLAAAEEVLAAAADTLWSWARAWFEVYPGYGEAYPKVLRSWTDDTTLDRLTWHFRPRLPGVSPPAADGQKAA